MNLDEMISKLKVLRIGPECFYNVTSQCLYFEDLLWLSFYYTYGMFYYNKELFMDYRLIKNPEDYLISDNPLYFNEKPISMYRQFYENLIEENLYRIGLPGCLKDININELNNPKYLNETFINNGKTLIVPLHVSLLKDNYKKYNGRYPVGGNTYHYVNLVDFDLDNNIAVIIDPYFEFKGKIHMELFLEAAFDSAHSHPDGKIYYLDISNLPLMDKIEAIRFNLSLFLEENIRKNDMIIYSFANSTKHFLNDLDEILDVYYLRYGKYSSQYLSFQLIYTRHQKSSLVKLLEIYKNESDDLINSNLITAVDENARLWNKLDAIFDLIFLRNQNIIEEKDRVENALKSILENENKITNIISSILL